MKMRKEKNVDHGPLSGIKLLLLFDGSTEQKNTFNGFPYNTLVKKRTRLAPTLLFDLRSFSLMHLVVFRNWRRLTSILGRVCSNEGRSQELEILQNIFKFIRFTSIASFALFAHTYL